MDGREAAGVRAVSRAALARREAAASLSWARRLAAASVLLAALGLVPFLRPVVHVAATLLPSRALALLLVGLGAVGSGIGAVLSYLAHLQHRAVISNAMVAGGSESTAREEETTSRTVLKAYGLDANAMWSGARHRRAPVGGDEPTAPSPSAGGRSPPRAARADDRDAGGYTPLPPSLRRSILRSAGRDGAAGVSASFGYRGTGMDEEDEGSEDPGAARAEGAATDAGATAGWGASRGSALFGRRYGEGDLATAIAAGRELDGEEEGAVEFGAAVQGSRSPYGGTADAGDVADDGSLFGLVAADNLFNTPPPEGAAGDPRSAAARSGARSALSSGARAAPASRGMTGATAYVQRVASSQRLPTGSERVRLRSAGASAGRSSGSAFGDTVLASAESGAQRSLLAAFAVGAGTPPDSSHAGGHDLPRSVLGAGASALGSADAGTALPGTPSAPFAGGASSLGGGESFFDSNRAARGAPEAEGDWDGVRRPWHGSESEGKAPRRLLSGDTVYADLDAAEAVLRERGLEGAIANATTCTRDLMARVLAETVRRLDAANDRLEQEGGPMQQEAVVSLLRARSAREAVPWISVPLEVACEDAMAALYPMAADPRLKAVVIERFQLESFLSPPGEAHNRPYVAARLRELAADISRYAWDSGSSFRGRPWTGRLPRDADLVMHWFCCFMNEAMAPAPAQADEPQWGEVDLRRNPFALFPRAQPTTPLPQQLDKNGRYAFENDYFVDGIEYMRQTATRRSLPRNSAILRVLDDPPHYKVLRFEREVETPYPLEVAGGDANVWHCIILFLSLVDAFENGRVSSVDTAMLMEQIGLRSPAARAAGAAQHSSFLHSFSRR